jgi:hypothetical protein
MKYIHDQIKHYPEDTMYKLETFLKLSHVNYTDDILNSISHNANVVKSSAITSNISSSTLTIHKAYSFEAEKEFSTLSRNVLRPSLCLFENLFGWKIHLITGSEIEASD